MLQHRSAYSCTIAAYVQGASLRGRHSSSSYKACTTFIPVPELSIFVLSEGYTQNYTRSIYPGYYPTKNFCNFCRTLIPVPELLEIMYAGAAKTRDTGTAFLYLLGTSVSSVRPCHNTRKFWNFCKTFIPVPRTWKFCKTFIPGPGTSVSSVRSVLQYPRYGYELTDVPGTGSVARNSQKCRVRAIPGLIPASKGAKNNKLTGKKRHNCQRISNSCDWHTVYTDALIGNNTYVYYYYCYSVT